MALDLKWLLSADDKASGVFDKVHQSGKQAAAGIEGAFTGLRGKFDLITGAVGGLAALAGGMAFKSIIDSTVNWNLETAKLGKTLGMTLEQASVYKVALHTYGIEQDVAEQAGLRLAKTLGKNEEVFQKLGVATRDSTGHLRSTADLMPEVNQKLNEMKAGTDRNVIAMEIYGKSWKEVQSLLKITPAAMKEAEEAAKRLHLIVGEEGVAQSKEYKKNLNELELVGKSLSIQFGNVLLPHLVKFGSYIGENAPILVKAFSYVLQFVEKVIISVGSAFGATGARVAELSLGVWSFLKGDFKEAGDHFKNMAQINIQYKEDMKKLWTNWDDPAKKSKAVGGKQLPIDDGTDELAAQRQAKLDAAHAKEVKAWEEKAKKIIEAEKQQWKELIDEQTASISKMEANYTSQVAVLDKFKDAMKAVRESWETPLGNDDVGLSAQEAKLNQSWADPAAKVKGLNDLIGKYRALYQQVTDGTDVIVSQAEADNNFRIAEDRIKDSIQKVADEMKVKEDATISLQQKIIAAKGVLEGYNAEVARLDQLLRALPDKKDININVRINSSNDLARYMGLSTGSLPSTASTPSTSSSVPGYDMGYTGPVAESVTVAAMPVAASSGGNLTISGGMHFNLPNVTNQSTADNLARQLVPALKKQLGRSL